MLVPAPHVRGRVRVPPGCDAAALMRHVQADLLTRECRVRADGDTRLVLESGAPGRYSPLSFVDGGVVWLSAEPGGTVLRYDLSTAGGLLTCLVLSPVCGAVAWFMFGDAGLALFGLLAPVVWLYGANYVTACVRVPGLFGRLCRTAPSPNDPFRTGAGP